MTPAQLATLDAARHDAATVTRCLGEAAHAEAHQVAWWLTEAHTVALRLVGHIAYARSGS